MFTFSNLTKVLTVWFCLVKVVGSQDIEFELEWEPDLTLEDVEDNSAEVTTEAGDHNHVIFKSGIQRQFFKIIDEAVNDKDVKSDIQSDPSAQTEIPTQRYEQNETESNNLEESIFQKLEEVKNIIDTLASERRKTGDTINKKITPVYAKKIEKVKNILDTFDFEQRSTGNTISNDITTEDAKKIKEVKNILETTDLEQKSTGPIISNENATEDKTEDSDIDYYDIDDVTGEEDEYMDAILSQKNNKIPGRYLVLISTTFLQ